MIQRSQNFTLTQGVINLFLSHSIFLYDLDGHHLVRLPVLCHLDVGKSTFSNRFADAIIIFNVPIVVWNAANGRWVLATWIISILLQLECVGRRQRRTREHMSKLFQLKHLILLEYWAANILTAGIVIVRRWLGQVVQLMLHLLLEWNLTSWFHI